MAETEPVDIGRYLPDSVKGLPIDHLMAVIERSLLDARLEILTRAAQDPTVYQFRVKRGMEKVEEEFARWNEAYEHLNLPRL